MIGLGCALGTGLFPGSGSAIGTAGPAVILSRGRGPAGPTPPVRERTALLRRAADLIEQRFEEFVAAEVGDTGKPVTRGAGAAAGSRGQGGPQVAVLVRQLGDGSGEGLADGEGLRVAERGGEPVDAASHPDRPVMTGRQVRVAALERGARDE
ncbi:hypothetical protein [Streptomyces capitiformicae]|uniref:Uncharacterized protein n=1 Tax=Streptomyces capitiformicae TaxID=2014920 RepID=A0A919DGX7_9ACTN|nr:hypothetical protein [Streptomyces capitiformicae]GHE41966.1 hypothetical protein GCM10017771_61460 [Streptomyces capitiformicae]